MSYTQSSPMTGGALSPFTGGQLDPITGLPLGSPLPYGLTGIPLVQAQQQMQQPPHLVSQTTQNNAPAQLPNYGPDDAGLTSGGVDGPSGYGLGAPAGAPDTIQPAKHTPQNVDSMNPGGVDGPSGYGLGAAALSPSKQDAPAGLYANASTSRVSGSDDPQAAPSTDPQQAQIDRLWGKITGGESGGSADPTHAKNPQSSAYGKAQFIDATRDRFLSSPAGQGFTVDDFKNKPEVQRAAFDWLVKSNAAALAPFSGGKEIPDGALEASHALGVGGVTALMQRPGEKAITAYNTGTGHDNGQSALIDKNKAWGITANDTADTALHKIAAYYDKRGGGSQPASATTQSPAAVPASDPAASQAAVGDPKASQTAPATPNTSPGLPTQIPGWSPLQPSDKMLALAGGIMQGGPGLNGLVNGFGKGIQDMQQMSAKDQVDRFKAAQESANTSLLRERLGLVGAQTGAIGTKLDQGQQGLDLKGQALDNQAQAQQQRIGTMNGRLQLGQDNLQATLDGSKAFGGKVGAESAVTAHQMTGDTAAAASDMQQIADLHKVIGDNPNAVGGSYQAGAARFLADKFGIDAGVNPDANSVAQKLVANFANQTALGQGKGIGGRITQQEFKQFGAASANLGTRPEAWKAMLDTYEQAAQRRLDVANEYAQLRKDPRAFQSTLTSPGGLGGWYQDRLLGQNQQRGITPTTSPAPQYATPQGGGIIHSGGGSGGVPAYTVERIN